MVSRWRYVSGETVNAGDHLRYHNEPGRVDFVVSERTGDSASDWYVDEYGGGLMMTVENYGSVFLPGTEIGEDLEFVARGKADNDVS
jgi:hypothetical protein